MDRSEDDEVRRRGQRLDEHGDIAVLHRPALLTLHQGPRIGEDVVLQARGQFPLDHPVVVVEHGVQPLVGAGDHGEGRPEPLGVELAANRLEVSRHHVSMYTWMVPPQARPTSKASSSAMP